jgi:hypothetical protein
MSYASSRIPVGASSTDILTSVNIGSTFSPSTVAVPLTLTSGVVSTLLTALYPIGVFTGYLNIVLSGDATTDIEALDVFENAGGGAPNLAVQTYFVATILPNTGDFFIKYPITYSNLDGIVSAMNYQVYPIFTGTAPTIVAMNMEVIKVV